MVVEVEERKEGDRRLEAISAAIRVIPDFPKPGIMFNDITTLLLHPEAFRDAVEIFVERYKDMDISAVAGIEARGFIFGPPIALAIGAKFVPLRKPRKLPGINGLFFHSSIICLVTRTSLSKEATELFQPYRSTTNPRRGEVISEAYILEYGSDCLEMHVGAVQKGERILIVDDLVATGGTLAAAIRLLERVGADVVECACVIGLRKIKDQCMLNGKPIYVLVECRR